MPKVNPETYAYALGAIAVIWAVTYALRAFPFVALRGKEESPLVGLIATSMPLGVMVILVVFALMDTDFGSLASWVPAAGGILITAAIHFKWANAMVSIVAGVATYWALGMLLI
ncbi:AzlD domain-containing protein [Varibaculum cambriense]|uniref:branched-chain amino acid transporter permease n=1 Tax=Varibaculum cambriense TaxID=184870 RepID=UPI002910961B|nr:AzlD domain-containing protein [Varibaculum cambriense]MDU5542292.1 AzlD domain-containing protein [Varibaculum cambriense]